MALKESIEKIDEVFDNHYNKIRVSLEGLKDIFKINFLDNNFYSKCALDNIQAIYDNVIELLKLKYTPRKVRIKLRELNINEFETQETYLK